MRRKGAGSGANRSGDRYHAEDDQQEENEHDADEYLRAGCRGSGQTAESESGILTAVRNVKTRRSHGFE